MSKFMPPKPEFYAYTLEGGFQRSMLFETEFHSWFAKEIAPLFQNAVEVWETPGDYWSEAPSAVPVNFERHKALLLNIQPIKEESADDILREVVDTIASGNVDGGVKAFDKAKAYLEKLGK